MNELLVVVLLVILVVGDAFILIMGVVILRVINRAVRKRDAYEAAAALAATASAEAATEAQEISRKLVHLKGEHVQVTQYLHKSVHDIRDALGVVSNKVDANHLETTNELAKIVKLIGEIRTREASYLAADKGPPPPKA